MNLYPHQADAIEKTLIGFKEFDKQVGVAPTGSGKTIMFATLAERFMPGNTLILAHREELIYQASDKIIKTIGYFPSIEKAEYKADLDAQIVVGSVQTLIRRLDKWPADHFNLIVVDEAHHTLADSYQTVLSHFDKHAKILGVTATPDRSDKRNLGNYFENIAFEINLFDLIDDGYLSPIKIKPVPIKIDLNDVSQNKGDFDADELDNALTPYLTQIVDAIVEHAQGRKKIVVFLPLIATSEKFRAISEAAGFKSIHVDGKSKFRKQILSDFDAGGHYNLLSNALLLTEGWDCPSVDCIVNLRPTRSRSMFSQIIGRGTRICQGKDDLLFLDILWQHEKHPIVRPANLIAQSQEEADQITKRIFEKTESGGESQDEFDLQDTALECAHEREKAMLRQIKENAHKKAKFMDARELAVHLHAMNIAEFEDTMPWHSKPISEGQARMLTQYGVDPDTVHSRGHASAIIDAVIARSKLNLATPKQVKLMSRLGHKAPESVGFDDATAFIDSKLKKKEAA